MTGTPPSMATSNSLRLVTQALEDGRTGRGSSKRLVSLIATVAMSLAVVILAVAACYGNDVSVAITGVSAALSGLAGYSYVNGKAAEGKRDAA